MWSTVELREIRLFLTLAEELHFGRTAERLQLTPSRVSQTLRELEAKLGGRLVHRTSRQVELTARGEHLRQEIAELHEGLMAALKRTHDEGRALNGVLRLGLQTPIVEGPQMPAIIRAFERRNPDCHVEMNRAPYGDAFTSLRRGEFDLLATWLPHGQPDLVVGPTLTREALLLGVAEDHPLAERDEVSIEDVAEHLVVPMEEVQPEELVERWIPKTTPNGRTIHRLRVPFAQMARDDPGELRNQMSWWIRTGKIVHPAMGPTQVIIGPGIVWVPISDMPAVRSALVWLRGESNERLREFARVAREVLEQDRGGIR
jgi:DNA-binding transcriptional LysR family regulator